MKNIIMMPKRLILLAFSIITLISSQAFAAISSATADAVVIQADGKIVAAGYATVDGVLEFAVARYTTQGYLDTSFNSTGVVTTAIDTEAQAFGVALQSDGKIVVTGFAVVNGVGQIALVRYNSDGSLDTDFGPDQTGIVVQEVGDIASAQAVVIQSDGRIVVAATTFESSVLKFVIVRFNSDGTLDTNFGTSGITITPIGDGASANAIALQVAGKIILGGFASVSGVQQFALARYNTDGTLDTNFGTSGIVTTPIGDSSNLLGVKLQSDGYIVAAGSSDNSIALARYDSFGTLDTSYGDSGTVVTSIGQTAVAYALQIQSDDKAVVAGNSDNSSLIARYDTDGILDTTFTGDGITLVDTGANSAAYSLAIQSNGKLVTAGVAGNDFMLLRFETDGTPDTAFARGKIIPPTQEALILNRSLTILKEEQSSGVNGGTFTSGAWQTRTLNTINGNLDKVSLSSNQFTLQPGTYEIYADAPAYNVNQHQIRLYNVTDSVAQAYGSSELANNNNLTLSSPTTHSHLRHFLYVPVAKTFRIEHRAATTESNDGFGLAGGFGNTEVYTQVRIESIK
jgi:uncharacterized delta-60 repeat protein